MYAYSISIYIYIYRFFSFFVYLRFSLGSNVFRCLFQIVVMAVLPILGGIPRAPHWLAANPGSVIRKYSFLFY